MDKSKSNHSNSEENDLNYWKIEKFEEKDNPYPVVEKSSFSLLFPKYREEYFKLNFKEIKNELFNHGVECEIDYLEGSIGVSTSNRMWDPYIIIKARDMVKFIARSVPFENAKKILNDGVFCELINLKVKYMTKERFIKRRSRLIGPDKQTLKSLEILCSCYIHIQGNTASVIGTPNSIKTIKSVIVDTMFNVHPVYNIKALMVKHELSQNENMKKEDWSKYIPKYKTKMIKKKARKFKKRDNEAFPPPPVPSKVDIELETGEYFLKPHEKRIKKMENKLEKQLLTSSTKKQEAENIYIPPKEKKFNSEYIKDPSFSIEKIKKNLKKSKPTKK